MTRHTASLLSPGARLLCAAVALVATCALAGALLAAWHYSAEPVWLRATPQVLAELAACDGERDRTARARCKQGLVNARESRSTTMASR